MKLKLLGAAVATGLFATSAMAAVTLIVSGNSVSGFVGKGDVQAVFGLNNAAMQNVHTAVTFDYDYTTGGTYVCEWITGPEQNRTVHRQTKTVGGTLSGIIVGNSRQTGQWTGWNISGTINQTGGDGDLPNVGDPCPGFQGNEKQVVEVSADAGGSGGLYATINGDRRLIYTP